MPLERSEQRSGGRRSSILKVQQNGPENVAVCQDTTTFTKRLSRRVSFAENRVVKEFDKDGAGVGRSPRQEPAYKDSSLSSNEASRVCPDSSSGMSLTQSVHQPQHYNSGQRGVLSASQATNLSVESMQETALGFGSSQELHSISAPMQMTVIATPGSEASVHDVEKTEAFMKHLMMASTPCGSRNSFVITDAEQHPVPVILVDGAINKDDTHSKEQVGDIGQEWQEGCSLRFPLQRGGESVMELDGIDASQGFRSASGQFQSGISDHMQVTDESSAVVAENKTEMFINMLERPQSTTSSCGSDEMSLTETECPQYEYYSGKMAVYAESKEQNKENLSLEEAINLSIEKRERPFSDVVPAFGTDEHSMEPADRAHWEHRGNLDVEKNSVLDYTEPDDGCQAAGSQNEKESSHCSSAMELDIAPDDKVGSGSGIVEDSPPCDKIGSGNGTIEDSLPCEPSTGSPCEPSYGAEENNGAIAVAVPEYVNKSSVEDFQEDEEEQLEKSLTNIQEITRRSVDISTLQQQDADVEMHVGKEILEVTDVNMPLLTSKSQTEVGITDVSSLILDASFGESQPSVVREDGSSDVMEDNGAWEKQGETKTITDTVTKYDEETFYSELLTLEPFKPVDYEKDNEIEQKLIESCVTKNKRQAFNGCVEKLETASEKLRSGVEKQINIMENTDPALASAFRNRTVFKHANRKYKELLDCCARKAELEWIEYQGKIAGALASTLEVELSESEAFKKRVLENRSIVSRIPVLQQNSSTIERELDIFKDISCRDLDVAKFLKLQRKLTSMKDNLGALQNASRKSELQKQKSYLELIESKLRFSTLELEIAQQRQKLQRSYVERFIDVK